MYHHAGRLLDAPRPTRDATAPAAHGPAPPPPPAPAAPTARYDPPAPAPPAPDRSGLRAADGIWRPRPPPIPEEGQGPWDRWSGGRATGPRADPPPRRASARG
eukprot:958833-Lingulodinium_polyedra.AAC.1